MKQTSLEAYKFIRPELARRQAEVYLGFKKYGEMTNLELSKLLKIPINQVTARTNELCKKHLLRESHKRKCTVSGRMAIVWGLR